MFTYNIFEQIRDKKETNPTTTTPTHLSSLSFLTLLIIQSSIKPTHLNQTQPKPQPLQSFQAPTS